MAKARHRAINQARQAGVKRRPAVTKPLHRAGAEIFKEDIDPGQQPVKDRPVGPVLQIQCDGLLAVVQRGEITAFPLNKGRKGP